MLPALAFWLPTQHGDVKSVPPDVRQTLKVEATHTTSIRANRLQVVEADIAGREIVKARVAWRTLFGLKIGTTRLDGGSVRSDFDYPTFGAVWAAFLAAEVGIAARILYAGFRDPG